MQEFLDERSAKFDTLQTLARDMRVTFSGFLRGVKQGTLSAENCLRLAEVLGEEPAVIFRAANKHSLADQFERLYGKTTNPLTEEERDLVERWRALSAKARDGLRLTIHELPRRDSSGRVPESHTTKAPVVSSTNKRDGRDRAQLSVPPDGQTDPVPPASEPITRGGRVRAGLVSEVRALEGRGVDPAARSSPRAPRQSATAPHRKTASHSVRDRKPRG